MKRIISMVLVVLMIASILPVSIIAAGMDSMLANASFTVLDNDESTLAPGVTMNELVVHNKNNERVEMYVTTVDTTLDTVMVKANYMDNQNQKYGMQTLSAQVAAMEANYAEPFKVVAGINASYYNTSNGKPLGAFVMEGVDVTGSDGDSYAFFAILKDGTYMIGAKGEYSKYKGQIQEAVQGHIHLVKDGAVVSGLDKTTLYPRQTLGLTADGKLIIMTADGSQAPKTVGITIQEQAEIMLELGCVEAVHLDGGNSTTFGAVCEGDDEFVLMNSPSGGGERTVSSTVVIISTAIPSGIFDHAIINGNYDYLVPNSTYTFTATGADNTNAPAEIPEDVEWVLSDTGLGTIENGVFKSNGTLGTVDVQLVYNDAVVGSKTINVVNPTDISFALDDTSVPYGKAVTLEYSAKYGYNDVYCADDAFNCSVNPAAAGTVDGFTFTAGNDTAITDATFTAVYKYSSDLDPISIGLAFGKGSDVLFDFEDGDISDWHAKETIAAWYAEKNQNRSTKLTNPCVEGTNTADEGSYVFLASEEDGGHVRNGEYALGVHLDHSQADSLGSWIYDYLFYTGEEKVLRDVANGVNGIRLGMWIYNPGVTNVSLEMYPYCNGGSTMNNSYAKIQGQSVDMKYSTNYAVPESGWLYAYVNLTNKGDDVIQTFGADHDAQAAYHSRYPAMGRFITGGAIDDPQDLILYIDDITLDYSDATDDRDVPVISNPMVSTDGSNDVALNGQTVDKNTLSFNATVADVSANNMTGLDYSTAKIYVDGVDMSADANFKAANGVLSLNNVTLVDGTHSVAFVVCDKQGNEGRLTKTLTVDTASAEGKVYLAGRNDGNDTPKAGSVYYVDVKAADASKIAAITTTLKLNTAHSFEYNNITCADGVSVEKAYDHLNRELTLTITHDGTQSGDTALVSVPVRVWAYDGGSGALPILNIECKTLCGDVTYTDAAFDSYAGGFYTALNVATEYIGANTTWDKIHKHSAAAISDKAVDCTTDGYTGRTYCDGCASVIDWGTTIAATGHSYKVVENKIACACGTAITSTGLYDLDGVNYYLVNGELSTGWVTVDDVWYYFDATTYAGVDGKQTADNGVTFTFDNGRVTSGEWVENAKGRRYWYGPGYYRDTSLDINSCRAYEIDGKTYLFSRDGYMQTGIHYWMYRLLGNSGETLYYDCGEDGVATLLTAPYKGKFYKDGVRVMAYQLVESNGDYYFVGDGNLIVTNSRVYLGATIEGHTYPDGTPMVAGYYEFDADGKMILKNGPIDGYFYKNGIKLNAYQLVEYNGDYYFISDGNKYATNARVYLNAALKGHTKPDGTPFAVGYYEFGADGKMIVYNGPVNGYFYKDGVKLNAYQLVEYNGDFYFITDGNKYAVNTKVYLNAALKGHTKPDGTPFAPGYYEFDAEGKMIVYNGPVGGYFYVDGVKLNAYQLVEYKGDYYFITDGNKYAVNTKVYLNAALEGHTKPDGTPFAPGYYEFDAEGKLVIYDGPVGGFFYENGVKLKAYQLVEYNGDFYFISDGNKYVAGTKVYLNAALNGHTDPDGNPFKAGYYEFDADGKMILK